MPTKENPGRWLTAGIGFNERLGGWLTDEFTASHFVPQAPALRDYQAALDADIRDAYRRGARRVLAVAPTGSGKTILFAHVVAGAARKGRRVLILAHRVEILEQIGAALDRHALPSTRHVRFRRREGAMSAAVLISGSIFRAPERRVSKAGKPFVSASVKVRDGDGFQFWRVIVFSESIGDELLRLGDGDSVSVQGALRCEPYEKNGETLIGHTLIASQVLALRGAKKKATASPDRGEAADRHEDRQPEPSKRHALDRYGVGGADPALDDEIPF